MKTQFPALHSTILRLSALSSVLASISGCALDTSDGLSGGDHIEERSQRLIGGRAAAPYHFRSTVGIADRCTAAKVGPHLFLTAAHCVAPKPGRGPGESGLRPDGLAPDFGPGERILLNYGLEADDAESMEVTIVETHAHPSWQSSGYSSPTRSPDGSAADIAVFQILEDTPLIPEAQVELGTVPVGTQVGKLGFGCQLSIYDENIDGLETYKAADAWTVPIDHIDHEQERGSFFSDFLMGEIESTYLITQGHDQGENFASLCPGDSGGPLYLPHNNQRRIVGVNADYTFLPGGKYGVSWTDWHTKTALNANHETGVWLVAFGLNWTGAELPTGEGSITRERWNNVAGTSVSAVPIYRPADSVQNIQNFELTPGSVQEGDNYGVRVLGYLTPPRSGNYIFHIAGDDNVSLRLSSDEHSYNAQEIAHHTGYTGAREWDKYATQTSAEIYLTAGQRYYIEANMKEAYGDDHLAVAWNLPGQPGKPQIIPGSHLSPLSSDAGEGSECTCPSGCESLSNRSVPFTAMGGDEGCFFFDELGYSINSFGMSQVNLNGQDISNRWIGNWSYPKEVDGGYYLYIDPQYSWGQTQVSQ